MRSEFEKWFKTSRSYLILKEANYYDLDLFEFNKSYNRYVHSGVQIAFETWEHRQTEVDELQKRIQSATAKWISVVSILTTTESNVPDVIYKQLDELHDALCGYELEQALKGGGE